MVDKQSLLVSSKMGRKAGSFANLNWPRKSGIFDKSTVILKNNS